MKVFIPALCIFLSLVIMTSLPSCTKETITTVIKTDTITITKTDTITRVVNDSSILGRLSNKRWILDSVYNNYTGPGTGNLIYVRGAAGNSVNYDKVISIYWRGGDSDSYNSAGTLYPYKWRFTGSDSSNFIISSGSTPVYYARILKLTTTQLTVYDSTSSALDIQSYKP